MRMNLLQETFARAIERPPVRTGTPWRPWLVRVAMNLGRDWLRRRRRRSYVGPWLPSPIETGDESLSSFRGCSGENAEGPEGRYEMLESVSYAFLLALEALTSQQRAVFLLRDVLDYSARETAETLGLSEANVKTTHHRSRRAMRNYDLKRFVPTRTLQVQTRQAVERLMDCLTRQDVAGVGALLSENVRTITDSNGEFMAARVPVEGRKKVARFLLKIAQRKGGGDRVMFRMMNALPAVVVESAGLPPGWASRSVLRCDLDRSGRIKELHNILALRKLTGVRLASGG